jgi:hypothetical protein
MHFYAFPRDERPEGGYANPRLYRCDHVADFIVVARWIATTADPLQPPRTRALFLIAHFDFYMADNLVEFLQSRGEKT